MDGVRQFCTLAPALGVNFELAKRRKKEKWRGSPGVHDCADKRRNKMKENKRKKAMRRGSQVVYDCTDMCFMAGPPRKGKKGRKEWTKE